MKVSHHGSADPGLPERAASACGPQVAAIEVGAGNDYGHPAPQHAGRAARACRTSTGPTATAPSCCASRGGRMTRGDGRVTRVRPRAVLDSAAVPSFKAAYLIHGDDHGRIGERRTRLRAMAEAESGTAGVEVFEAEACTPEAVAGALSAMTFAIGRRFVIADGVERWKDAERRAGRRRARRRSTPRR